MAKDGFLKKIEIAFRKLFMKAIASGKKPVLIAKPEAHFTNEKISRVLLIRTDRIGDFIISTGILRHFKKALPNIQIDILLSRKNYSTMRAAKIYCRNVLIYDKHIPALLSLISRIRKERYTLVIDLYDNASATASLFTYLSGARFKLGIEKSNSEIYTHIVPMKDKQRAHIIERVGNLLLAFGLDPEKLDLSPQYLFDSVFSKMKIKSKKIKAGINLAGSSAGSKYWGKDNYVYFLGMAAREYKDAEFILFSTSEYEEDAKYIAGRTNALKAPVTSNFDDYAAALSVCNLIITPDTAAVHLASAFKIPCLALYEASETDVTGTLWTPYKIPCKIAKSYSGSLSDIKPEEVLKLFRELVSETEYMRKS